MKHGDVAWIVVAAGIVIYEAAAPKGELLSEAVDRYRARHPFITNTVIAYVSLHLLRQWPRHIDPLHQLAVKLNK
jgi:hypothetical protein